MLSILPSLLYLFCIAGNLSSSGLKNPHEELRKKLAAISSGYKATVGVAVIHLERGDTVTLHNDAQYPMQSTYKFPLALAVLHQADQGKIRLDQKIHISKEDLMEDTWSPLKKDYPKGNVELTIAKLLAYSVSQSDNIACDLLFNLMKGPLNVNNYVHGLGIKDIEILNTEREMHSNSDLQYKNRCSPMAMTKLLEGFYEKKYLSDSLTRFLIRLMTESTNSSNRIRGMLPKGTIVAHKTGTGSLKHAIIPACNDIGIITMPDGSHVALSVFVSRSAESYAVTEKLIAMLAKEVFDYFNK